MNSEKIQLIEMTIPIEYIKKVFLNEAHKKYEKLEKLKKLCTPLNKIVCNECGNIIIPYFEPEIRRVEIFNKSKINMHDEPITSVVIHELCLHCLYENSYSIDYAPIINSDGMEEFNLKEIHGLIVKGRGKKCSGIES